MAPKKNVKSKKLHYKRKHKHMMEVRNRKRQLECNSDESSLSTGPVLRELQNVESINKEQIPQDFVIPRKKKTLQIKEHGSQSFDTHVSGNYSPALKIMTENEVTPQCHSSKHNMEIQLVQSQQAVDEAYQMEMGIEKDAAEEKYIGRRIISVSTFFKKIQEMSDHGPLGCNLSSIVLIGEKQDGLISKFTFVCKLCNLKFYINNDNAEDNYLDVNSCAVAGIIAVGGGHSNLSEFCAAINLPVMSNKTYQSRHKVLSKNWFSVAEESMKNAAEIERNSAIEEGKVSTNGIPIIDVIADGCYSKRSYKKNYSALSGAGAIIGRKTGQILYLGIRNKYCFFCDRADKKNIQAKDHNCYKNYAGPSTGMETEILVEGFKQSIASHNLIYGRLISDGDSSTYTKILQSRPYQNEGITVEKIECRNHLLRNFCNKMQLLRVDTRYPVRYRKIITNCKIMCLRQAIIKVIKKKQK